LKLHIPKLFLLSIIVGLFLLGISAFVTETLGGISMGFPLTYSRPNPGCQNPNPLNGCGYSYDVLLIALDYLIWLTIALVLVSAITLARTRFSSCFDEGRKKAAAPRK